MLTLKIGYEIITNNASGFEIRKKQPVLRLMKVI